MIPRRYEHLTIVKPDANQWAIINELNLIWISKNYGEKATYFKDILELCNSKKVVTLNGSPMKNKGTKRSIADRINEYHAIFEDANGRFAVASQEFLKDLFNQKGFEIKQEQIRYYNYKHK